MNARIAVSALMLLFGSLPASAQTFNVCTRVGSGRPGCDQLGETTIEITNLDPTYWYKVQWVGMNRVANHWCGTDSCKTNFAGLESLAPHNQTGFCKARYTQLPSNLLCSSCSDLGESCEKRDCDNIASNPNNCPDCVVTCGNPALEWCVELVDFRAWIVAYSTNGVRWTSVTDHVLASKGAVYGNFPPVHEESYCTNHAPIFEPCSPPPSLCVQYGE